MSVENRLKWRPTEDSAFLSTHECRDITKRKTSQDIDTFIQFEQGWFWVVEVYADKMDVEAGEAQYIGECLCGNGIRILYCPFCGKGLDQLHEIGGDENE